MKVKEAGTEGDEVWQVAQVLDKEDLAVWRQDAMRFTQQMGATHLRAYLMCGKEEKDCVAIAVREWKSCRAAGLKGLSSRVEPAGARDGWFGHGGRVVDIDNDAVGAGQQSLYSTG